MTTGNLGIFKGPLEPIDRVSEALFGVIMVLTYTTAITVADDSETVRTVLISAIGCNLAWGIIDAVFYLMGCMAEKSRGLMKLHAVRNTQDEEEARQIISSALPSVLVRILHPDEFISIHKRLVQLPEPPQQANLQKDDWLAALGVFFWVFLITFPVAFPFLLMEKTAEALLVSNTIGIALLFILGYAYGHCVARNPWSRGIIMVICGSAMVMLCRALGG